MATRFLYTSEPSEELIQKLTFQITFHNIFLLKVRRGKQDINPLHVCNRLPCLIIIDDTRRFYAQVIEIESNCCYVYSRRLVFISEVFFHFTLE